MQADAPAGTDAGKFVTATAVTTRTATTHEDLGTNAKTQQLEEKTVATTTTQHGERQEQRVITQEVKTTATVTSGDQVRGHGFGLVSLVKDPIRFVSSWFIYAPKRISFLHLIFFFA